MDVYAIFAENPWWWVGLVIILTLVVAIYANYKYTVMDGIVLLAENFTGAHAP